MTPSSTTTPTFDTTALLMNDSFLDLALLWRTCYEPLDSTHPDTQGSAKTGG